MAGLLRDTLAREGVAGLYRGVQTTVTRAVVIGSVKLACYDETKLFLERAGFAPGGAGLIVAAAVTTGLLVSLTSAPIDFAR